MLYKSFKTKIFLSMILVLTLGFSLGIGAESWVAKLNGKLITKSDFESILESQKVFMETSFGNGKSVDSQLKNKAFQRQILEATLLTNLTVEEIKKENAKNPFISAAAIEKDKELMSKQIENALWLRAYIQKILRPNIKIDASNVSRYYKNNQAEFDKQGLTKEQAYEVIKENMILRLIGPKISELQAKIQTEQDIVVNENYFK